MALACAIPGLVVLAITAMNLPEGRSWFVLCFVMGAALALRAVT